jgi:hypothetical protein
LIFFLVFWDIFVLLDPDPNSESGSADLTESGSNPDPKYWSQPESSDSVKSEVVADEEVLNKADRNTGNIGC